MKRLAPAAGERGTGRGRAGGRGAAGGTAGGTHARWVHHHGRQGHRPVKPDRQTQTGTGFDRWREDFARRSRPGSRQDVRRGLEAKGNSASSQREFVSARHVVRVCLSVGQGGPHRRCPVDHCPRERTVRNSTGIPDTPISPVHQHNNSRRKADTQRTPWNRFSTCSTPKCDTGLPAAPRRPASP